MFVCVRPEVLRTNGKILLLFQSKWQIGARCWMCAPNVLLTQTMNTLFILQAFIPFYGSMMLYSIAIEWHFFFSQFEYTYHCFVVIRRMHGIAFFSVFFTRWWWWLFAGIFFTIRFFSILFAVFSFALFFFLAECGFKLFHELITIEIFGWLPSIVCVFNLLHLKC